jgi:hypothetical protein
MFYQTEAKFQGWRAVAVFENGAQFLIFVGRSTTQVRAGYAAAFRELLDEEERGQIRKISLQCWQGAADKGKWIQKTTLAIPAVAATAKRDPATADAEVLPFRKPVVSAAADVAAARRPAGQRLVRPPA